MFVVIFLLLPVAEQDRRRCARQVIQRGGISTGRFRAVAAGSASGARRRGCCSFRIRACPSYRLLVMTEPHTAAAGLLSLEMGSCSRVEARARCVAVACFCREGRDRCAFGPRPSFSRALVLALAPAASYAHT